MCAIALMRRTEEYFANGIPGSVRKMKTPKN